HRRRAARYEDRRAAAEGRDLPGDLPEARRPDDRGIPAARAALRLRGERQSRRSRHRPHRPDGNRRPDLAHRVAVDRAHRDARPRRPARRLSALYAIPTPLGGSPQDALSPSTIQTIRGLRRFVVENAKTARAFLAALDMPVRELTIEEIGD